MRLVVLLAGLAALPFCASADLIIDTPFAPNVISFDDGGANHCSAGPTTTTLGGLTVSTNGPACFPYYGWSFGDNGQWNALPALADASPDGNTTITINLGGLFSEVYGFIDYGLSCPPDFSGPCVTYGNDPTITALDKNMNVIETLDLGANDIILGSNNEFDYEAGRTVGFSESSADIAYFQISGDNIAITNISMFTPEPTPFTLAFIALLALGFVIRRNIKSRGCDLPSSL